MAKLSTRQRAGLSSVDFAGPDRSYPIPDASHARNAIARAAQQENAHRLTAAQASRIEAKARHKLKSLKRRPRAVMGLS